MEIVAQILEKLYIGEKMPAIAIAKITGKCQSTIYNYLQKYGIKRRGRIECQSPIKIDKNELLQLYIIEEKSTDEIGSIYKVSEETVRRILISFNIPRRAKTCNLGGWNKGLKISNEQRANLSNSKKEYYKNNQHWNKGNNTSIETRKKISETLLNGRIPAPSDYGKDWQIQRTSRLQKDGRVCQGCGTGSNLEVHHRTPYRFCYNNALDNLVTLCAGCHRDIHKSYREKGFIKDAEAEFYA